MKNPGEPRRFTVSRRRFLQLTASAAAAAAAASMIPSLGARPAVAQPAAKVVEPDALSRRSASVAGGGLPDADRAAGAANGAPAGAAARAIAAYEAQQRRLYRPNLYPGDATSLYLEQTPQGDSKPSSFVWPFSQALAATLDLLGLPAAHGDYRADVQDRLYRGLPQYWDGSGYQPCIVEGDRHAGDGIWYDDNAWVGLDLVRAYRMTGDSAALDRGRQVFDYITTGWCNIQGHAKAGGIFWVRGNDNHHRNTCSNGPTAELGLRLYQVTGESSYLRWATRIYDWVNGALMDENGLYWDHIDMDGTIDRAIRSYNQGSMVGAGALLYKITGDVDYLRRAKRTAQAALDHYGLDGLVRQNPVFNATFFRNLLHLATLDDALLPATLRALQQYADHAWGSRNGDGLYPFPNSAAPTKLLHQSGMVQVFACLAWDPAQYDLLV